MAMKGVADRRLWAWIARAISSLPVPDSPEMKTLASVGATRETTENTFWMDSAGADDVLEAVVPLELVAQLHVVARELHLLRGPSDEDAELRGGERLGDVVVGARGSPRRWSRRWRSR
jgi:hypothetical protein